MIRYFRITLALALTALPLEAQRAPAPAPAVPVADSALLTVRRIYASPEFSSQSFGPTRWLEDGAAFATVERASAGKGREIVRYDTESGTRSVLITAAQLTPPGDTMPLAIENYIWSPDRNALLIFTNSQPVWRTNTRGDYWVLDRASGKLTKLGGAEAKPSTLMFAKFSPDGRRVGYVRENNLYVEDLAGGAIVQLTRDGSRTVINGTFDWVYEEELGLQDGWRWSPDGAHVAYWQLVADSVRDFTLINYTDSLYPVVTPIQYPKAGESNSAARIGVVRAAGGDTRWLALEGDLRNNYPARMEWAPGSDEVVVQRLNRLQNRLDLYLGNVETGAVRTILTEQDSTWVELVDDFHWLDDGKRFTWTSERDGWNHVYVVSRDGRTVRPVTSGAFDVLRVVGVDEKRGYLYYIASPENPTQRYLFRARLNGRGRPERLSPATAAGTHGYNASPDFRYAFHTYSRFGVPPVNSLIRLPGHQVIRTVVANDTLKHRVEKLRRGEVEFTQVDIGDGIRLNAYLMKPANFDPARRYPVLFQVYGGPGSQTVLDSWGGQQYLWHVMLTQQGYIVASVDNRGTGARGREWRKIIYGQLGVVETRDQAAAARVIGRLPYVDSTRMGIWGWSYGGFMSLNVLFQAPDVYSTAVAVAPVTHWKYYDNIYTERYNGLPSDNAAGYDRGSPLTYVDSMRGRLLVVHGSGDDNVHYQNTEALVNALVRANKPFDMMEYPNRNHGIFGGTTRLHLFELLTRYLDENLKGADRESLTF
ncbi:MAG TPA: S9 family peptidase [Gemmatimonadales bacterium]|nr:S9 family peptidase [Gemmatimonadales bacterium]